jgi:hypothetical protein
MHQSMQLQIADYRLQEGADPKGYASSVQACTKACKHARLAVQLHLVGIPVMSKQDFQDSDSKIRVPAGQQAADDCLFV